MMSLLMISQLSKMVSHSLVVNSNSSGSDSTCFFDLSHVHNPSSETMRTDSLKFRYFFNLRKGDEYPIYYISIPSIQ